YFLDYHGQINLTTRLRVTHSIASDAETGDLFSVGADIALYFRAISDQFLMGSVAPLVVFDLLVSSDHPALGGDTTVGYRVGGGLESNFGILWYLDPYLFAETGVAATASYIDVGAVDGVQLMFEWIIRFDWGLRDLDPDNIKEVDELYRLNLD